MTKQEKIMENQTLNRAGNRRGMSPNSLKSLRPRLKGNNHAKKGISITRIERDMLEQICPYTKDPTWTWAFAIADAEMRAALLEQKTRDSIKDRLEGKVSLPIEGTLAIEDTRELTDEQLAVIAATNIIKNHAFRGSDRTAK